MAKKIKFGNEFDNCEKFNFDIVSIDADLDGKIDSLFKGVKFKSDYKPISKKKLFKLVILNLIMVYQKQPHMFVRYSRDSSVYSTLARKHGEHASYRFMVEILESLISNKFIKDFLGKYFPSYKAQSRMRIGKPLLELLGEASIQDVDIDISPTKKCIFLRESVTIIKPVLDENKKPILLKRGKDKGKEKTKKDKISVDVPYDETPETMEMKRKLTAYNNLLRKSFIDIPDFPDEGIVYEGTYKNGKKFKQTIRIDDCNKFVSRIFNNGSWDDGGRFYGAWWVNLPKEWRDKIRINDEETVEVDFKGLHLKLLYNQEGITYTNDPYEIDIPYFKDADRDKLRQLVKFACLILINAKDEQSAVKGIIKDIHKNEKLHWFIEQYGKINPKNKNKKSLSKELINEILNPIRIEHEKISKHFMSGAGIKLMNLDSNIARDVIEYYTVHKAPVLCIHDSFIIPIRYAPQISIPMKIISMRYMNESLQTKYDETKVKEYLEATRNTDEIPVSDVEPNQRYKEKYKLWKEKQDKDEYHEDYYY